MRPAFVVDPRRTIRRVALAALGVVVTASACGRPAHVRTAPATARNSAAPGIVVLVMDTVRADALRAYGGRGVMPSLDAFAERATVFADASATGAWTAPSVASILTGLEPAHHGVLGPFVVPPLSQSVTTLAERLSEAGWTTAAVTGGVWVAPEYGMAQGFDAFGTTIDIAGPEARLAGWDARRAKDRPFFLFLHTYAAHDPYGEKRATRPGHEAEIDAAVERADRIGRACEARPGPPAPDDALFLARTYFLDAPARSAMVGRLPPARHDLLLESFIEWKSGPWAEDPASRDFVASLRDAYDDGLRLADRFADRALLMLEALRLPEGTVTVVCGDHGEGFGEHRALAHGGLLYDEILRVPLLVRAPGRLEPGVVRGSCSLADVMPTVLELAGLPASTGIDGRSLRALAAGEVPGRPVLAEEVRRKPGRPDEAPYELTSVRTERAKFVRTLDPVTGAAVDELFDLEQDPGEQQPLPLAEASRFGDAFCATVRWIRERQRRETAAGVIADPALCEGLLR